MTIRRSAITYQLLGSALDLVGALKSARKGKGLTQRALGSLVGIPQSHVAKIESGAVDLQLSTLLELSRALDLDLMLVPRKLVPAVAAILEATGKPPTRPAYSLETDEELRDG